MPAEMPVAMGGQDSLQFSDAAACRAWISRLPQETAQRHALLTSQIRSMAEAGISPAAKFGLLELLREPVAEAQAELAKDCRGKPLPLDAAEREAWEQILGTWRAMATGYDMLIDAMATTAPDLAAHAHVICQRALRYTGLALFEYCFVYRSPDGALWQQLHRLYVFAENAGFTSTTVNDSIGRRTAATNCADTYVHALLIHTAQPDSLSNEQLAFADQWLDRWESLVELRSEPPAQSQIPALAVDLASEKGAGLARSMPSAGVRHLDLESLKRAMHQAATALKQQSPEEIGLGSLSREACEKLLRGLFVQWCAAGTGRLDERTPASIKVMISPNLPSMHFHLSGKAFRQPGAELTAADRARLDAMGADAATAERALVSQRSAALETWTIVNQSVSGFLGTVREHEVVNRISHNQLVALQPKAKNVMYLGVVQRLTRDDSGTIWIGLRIILGAPQAAAVRISGVRAAQYERALLMPADAPRKLPASIVLEAGWHAPDLVLDLHEGKDKPRRIKLQALLDRGPNFDRATYSPA